MPRRPRKAKWGKKRDEAATRYESFRVAWERAAPARNRRALGRGNRPALEGPPRAHKTKAADFLDELLWLATFHGDDRFGSAYVAAHESGAIKDGRWSTDFRPRPPPGLTLDPFEACVTPVARLIHQTGWSQRVAFAWAVTVFDLPGNSFSAAVARMRATFEAANKAALVQAEGAPQK